MSSHLREVPQDDDTPERIPDPTGQAAALFRERLGTPVPERPGAVHGRPFGPLRSIGASWDYSREAAKAYGEVHPSLAVAVTVATLLRAPFHAFFHNATWLTERNGRFYGALLAGLLLGLVLLIITLAH